MDFSNKSLCFVLLVTLSAYLIGCDNPMTSRNSIDDSPLPWYGSPAWSPTGDWIAYEYYGIDTLIGIWMVRPDGSDTHFVTRGIVPDFSPDGKKLAFARGEKIFVRDLETDGEIQLTFEGSSFSPSWSPDGKQIAYDTNYQDPKGANVIWIMDSNGGNNKDVSQHGIGEWRSPDWFPNFRILHLRYGQGRGAADLFFMDSTGSNEIRLTTDGRENRSARVSPDGNQIVWERWEVGRAIAIWLMNSDGTDKKRLTDGFEPAWAPDSRHIIYRKDGDYVGGQPYDNNDPKVHGSLWMMNVDTREQWQFLPVN